MKYTSIPLGIICAILFSPLLVQADFDPNFLISDEEMQDHASMERADIDAFLKDKGGYISTLRTPDKNGVTRTVADIIYQASTEHRINPKYLLVKLQKEQSLITDTSPTQKALDGATGYGITDGCGWTCDTYINNKGFGKQVDSAAGIIRWYYEHAGKEPWIKLANKTYTIDTTQVRPVNNATAFLYTYTPHIEGNKNFWTLWQRWFDQVYPNGTLAKAAGSPTVYLIKEGKKHAFASYSVLTTRFDPDRVITVPASELARYSEGSPITLPNFSILKEGTNYYLLAYDRVRPFASHDVVRALGYNPDEIIPVTAADIAIYDRGAVIQTASTDALYGRVVRIKENGNLYYLNEGILHPITDPAIAKNNFPNLKEEAISLSQLSSPSFGDPILFRDGTLMLVEGSNKVYVIESGKKRHIASEDVFNGLGYHWDSILRTNEYTGLNHKTGQPLYLRSDASSPDQTVIAGQEQDLSDETHEEGTSSNDYTALMVRTPAAQLSYIGPTYSTDIETYLIADANGNILAGKNVDFVRPLASFTKVMTGYSLLLDGLSLARATTYHAAEHKATYHHFRIVENENVLNGDLFDAMLVSSLNTPVRMLVDSVEKDESAFVRRMNERASSLGLLHTTFTDVTGEKETTVSTARDYLTIYRKATGNLTMQQHLGKKSYQYDELIDMDGMPSHHDTHSNTLANNASLPYTVINSKTGYLYESGANLAMHIKRKTDNKEFYIITMGNVDFANRFAEPDAIARWAIGQF